MICPRCGQDAGDSKYCPHCGNAVEAPVVNTVAPTTGEENKPDMPMKWFKFLIYFSLWAGAVLNLISGIAMMSGSSYEGAADLVYAMFDGLQGLDTFCGLYAIALAAFGIFVRFQLAGYKKKAPLMLMILYIAAAAYGLIYIIGINAILPSYVLEAVDTTSMYSSMISSGVMVIINHIYFKKRAHMFVA